MPVLNVTMATFRSDVMESELPVLVALLSDRSPASRQVEPRLAEVARELEGRAKVARVSAESAPELVQALGARQLPTFVVVHQGRPVNSGTGLLNKQELVELVEPYLPGAEHEVPAKELPKLLKARQVVAVDVREAAAYRRAHIPGAKNVPVDDLESRLPELARERRAILVYDRSNGDDAKKAFETLTTRGLPAAVLKGGFLAWEGEGFDVERPD
ncbi:MAG: thioredoxin [Deltaproteobacteria bacterium]|nr:thioredoxin [Deltaproteobacteria bacterium]